MSVWPASGSAAVTAPTAKPAGTFSKTLIWSVPVKYGVSFTSFRLTVTVAEADSAGEPLSVTWTTRLNDGCVS